MRQALARCARFGHQRAELGGRLPVGKVPAVRRDALLDGVRVGPGGQHLRVVVALQRQDAHVAQRRVRLRRDDAGVRQVAHRVAIGGVFDTEAERRGGIVAGGEGDDAHARGLDGAGAGCTRRRILPGGGSVRCRTMLGAGNCRVRGRVIESSVRHTLAARRSASRRQLADVERLGHLRQRAAVRRARARREHRRHVADLRQPAQHHAKALHVVAVLVRHEHGLDAAGVEAGLVAAVEEVALADAAVDQHAGAGGGVLDHRGVPRASAGQYVQCEHVDPP